VDEYSKWMVFCVAEDSQQKHNRKTK